MHITGKMVEPQFTADGRLRLVLEVNERAEALQGVEDLKDEILKIDITKFRNRRSLNANDYFWQLIGMIGRITKTDKMTVYLMELSRWGVFTDLQVQEVALPILEKHFRYTERLDEWTEEEIHWFKIRGYYGSSTYDTKEMSELIEGTVSDAKDLGIDVLSPDEIARMIAAFKERGIDED